MFIMKLKNNGIHEMIVQYLNLQ